MEGDVYFVALTATAQDNPDLRVSFWDTLVEELGDVVTEENLVRAALDALHDDLPAHHFYATDVFVVQPNVPFAEPTVCRFKITFEGKEGAQEVSATPELTQLTGEFRIWKGFTLLQAFESLNCKAHEQKLGFPVAYSYEKA